jgi:outer membrane receptor protein involved in Fe transport
MTDPANGNTGPIFWDNPYFTRYTSFETDTRDRYLSFVTLNYKVNDWLNLMGRTSLDNYTDFREQRQGVGTVGVPVYQRYNGSFKEYNYDFLATANKDLGGGLNLKALAGANLRQDYVDNITAATNGGLYIPGFYSLANSLNALIPPTEKSSRQEVGGIFGGITLTYKDFLILDATERVDQASTLPEGNNRYSYPSVSGGFVFSKLMPDQTWLSLGKLRVNYASVGNAAPVQALADVYDNQTNAVDLTSNPSFGGIPLYAVNVIKNNAELKPEITRSYEGGLEMSFLNNRVGFDATYYHTNTKNQTIPVYISYATGYQRHYVNAGNVENKGIELSVNLVPVQTRSFTWNLHINWARSRNKVISLFPGADNVLLGSFQGGVSVNAAVGQPFGVLRGSDFVPDSVTGQRSVGANGYYVKSATTNNIIGNINPDWFGGITNTFTYKNISLGFVIDAKKGGSLFSIDQWYGQGTGLYAASAGKNDLGNPVRNDVANGGGVIFAGTGPDHKPNTKRVPLTGLYGYGYNNFPNSAYVYDASYIKLREVTLSYSVPHSALAKMSYVKGIDISLYGRNLWIIHKNLPDADPEDAPSSGNVQGVQVGSYPTYRNMGVNVKFNF